MTWVSLVFAFISIQLSWWVFNLPTLFHRTGSSKSGWASFKSSVIWTCMRAHSPGSTGFCAAKMGKDSSEFAKLYYQGTKDIDSSSGDLAPWKIWQLGANVLIELISLVAVAITLRQACTLPDLDVHRALGLSLWVYPTLPATLIGLSFLLGELIVPRSRLGNWCLFAFVLVVLAGVGAAVTVLLKMYDKYDGGGKAWYISLIFYCLMLVPLGHIHPILSFLWMFVAAFIRVGGVGVAALLHFSGGEPYCAIAGPAFGIVYLVGGVVAAALAAVGMVKGRYFISSFQAKRASHFPYTS
jgi:hypothetical protein